MDFLSIFCERLNDLITEKDLKNDVIAKELGVSSEAVRLWRHSKRYITLSQISKLADYLGCSIDYLAGRSEELLDYSPNDTYSFYPRLRQIMKEKGITRYALVKDTKIYDGYFTNWKNGADVHILTLILLADYFDVTIDYLVGKEG